jgi:NitT/TauT family transport system substrate-binding protein
MEKSNDAMAARRLLMRLPLALLALALAACGGGAGDAATASEGKTRISVQTDWFASTDHAALYAADYYGYFDGRGLDVEIRQGGPGIRAANDVATRRATFGLALTENIILAAAENVELLSVFATYQESPIGLMVHEHSGVTGIEGIAGLAVQIFPGQVFWEVLKHETGIAPDEMAFDGSMTAWAENSDWAVQAFATTNPFDARAAGVEPRMLTATQLGFRSYAGVIFTSRSYARENPEAVKAFAQALQLGFAEFLADPQPVIEYINAEVNQDFLIEVGEAAAAVMQKLAVSRDTTSQGVGAMSAVVWDDVATRMFNAGIIRSEVDASALWTNSYLESPDPGTGQ